MKICKLTRCIMQPGHFFSLVLYSSEKLDKNRWNTTMEVKDALDSLNLFVQAAGTHTSQLLVTSKVSSTGFHVVQINCNFQSLQRSMDNNRYKVGLVWKITFCQRPGHIVDLLVFSSGQLVNSPSCKMFCERQCLCTLFTPWLSFLNPPMEQGISMQWNATKRTNSWYRHFFLPSSNSNSQIDASKKNLIIKDTVGYICGMVLHS